MNKSGKSNFFPRNLVICTSKTFISESTQMLDYEGWAILSLVLLFDVSFTNMKNICLTTDVIYFSLNTPGR